MKSSCMLKLPYRMETGSERFYLIGRDCHGKKSF
jgi:hypothetical protein